MTSAALTSDLPAIDPARTALLVMDFQNGIIGRLPDMAAPGGPLAAVERAVADVRASGGTVGYVRVAFTEDDWAAIPATSVTFAAAIGNQAMHHENPATAVHDRLAPQPGDIVVRKTRIGALSTTDLDDQLRGRGIDTLVLAGISTSGVVLSTVIDAADRDYRLFVLSDGVADSDVETHTMLLTRVFPRRAHVIDTGQLRALLAG